MRIAHTMTASTYRLQLQDARGGFVHGALVDHLEGRFQVFEPGHGEDGELVFNAVRLQRFSELGAGETSFHGR